jgi:hypothetical protein
MFVVLSVTKEAGGDCASLGRPVVRLLFVISFLPFTNPSVAAPGPVGSCFFLRIAVHRAYVGWLGRWPLWELTTA